jgi:hypothetical protein
VMHYRVARNHDMLTPFRHKQSRINKAVHHRERFRVTVAAIRVFRL